MKNTSIREIKMCYKYFEFLYRKCQKYLEDNDVTEEEIHQLKIEFDRFIERIDNSKLPKEIKNKVSSIKLNYNLNHNSEYIELLGRWDITKNIRRRKLKKKLIFFKNEIKDIMDLFDKFTIFVFFYFINPTIIKINHFTV